MLPNYLSLFSLLILTTIVFKDNFNPQDLLNMLIWKPYKDIPSLLLPLSSCPPPKKQLPTTE